MAEDFHEAYAEAEKDFEKKADAYWQKERELRQKVRSMVAATPEQRQEAYIEGFTALEREYEEFHERTINAFHSKRVGEAEAKLFGPGNGRYADHLVSLAAAPDERLRELAAIAAETKQEDLARAVAHTARQRGNEALFRAWAASDEGRADALRYLERTPDAERFMARTYVRMRPIKATAEALEPPREEKRRYEEEQRKKEERERAKAKERKEFFDQQGGSRPKRKVGSRYV